MSLMLILGSLSSSSAWAQSEVRLRVSIEARIALIENLGLAIDAPKTVVLQEVANTLGSLREQLREMSHSSEAASKSSETAALQSRYDFYYWRAAAAFPSIREGWIIELPPVGKRSDRRFFIKNDSRVLSDEAMDWLVDLHLAEESGNCGGLFRRRK